MFKFKLAEAFVEMTARDSGLSAHFAKVENSIGGAFKTVTKLAAGIAGLAAAGGALAFVTKQASNFEGALSSLRFKLSDHSEHLMPMAQLQIRKLAEQYGMSVREISDSVAGLLGSTTSITDALSVTGKAARLAASGMAPLKTIVDSTDGIMDAFGFTAKDTDKILDQLVVAAQRGEGSFESFLTTINALAPSAGVARISFDEFLASVTALSRNRDEGKLNGLIGAMRYIGKLTEDEGDSAKDSAREVLSNTLAHKGWFAVLQQLRDSGDDVQKRLLNARGYETVATLTRNLASAQADLVAIQQASGQASRASAAGMGTLGHMTELLWEKIKLTAGQIGEVLLPGAKVFVEWALVNVAALSSWIASHSEMIKATAKSLATSIASSLTTLGTWLGRTAKQVTIWAGVFIATFTTIPEYAELFVLKVEGAISKLLDSLGHIGEFITDMWTWIWKSLQDWLGRIADRVSNFGTDLADVISTTFQDMWDGIWGASGDDHEQHKAEAKSARKRLLEGKGSTGGLDTAGPMPSWSKYTQGNVLDPTLQKQINDSQKKADDAYLKAQQKVTAWMNPASFESKDPMMQFANMVKNFTVGLLQPIADGMDYLGIKMGPDKKPGAPDVSTTRPIHDKVKMTSEIMGGVDMWKKIQTAILNPHQTDKQVSLLTDLKTIMMGTQKVTNKIEQNTKALSGGVVALPG